MDGPIRVIFVCLGNICRSPLAATVLRRQVARAGLSEHFRIDSAGISDYHVGETPDPRMAETAARHGVTLTGRARQVRPADVRDADYVIAMDRDNRTDLLALVDGEGASHVQLLRFYDPEAAGEADVPDPYYGGPAGFERVYEMVERSCSALLHHIRKEKGL